VIDFIVTRSPADPVGNSRAISQERSIHGGALHL